MSLSVLTRGGGGSGPSASIFVRGLNEIDAVKAIKRTPLLPEEYTQLKYIESTGTQHIDTGWIPVANSRIEMECNVIENSIDNFAAIFSTCNPTYLAQAWTVFVKVSGTWGLGVERTHPGGSSTIKRSSMLFDEDVTVTSYGNTATVSNGKESYTSTDSGNVQDSGVSAFLFAMRENNVPTHNAYMKLYSFKGYSNEKLVRHFVPARRNADGEVGLYDLVESKFYTNAGSGNFNEGPENIGYVEIRTPKVPEGYTEVEYIEGTGTQYIDTGVIATQNTGISLDLIVNNPLSSTAHGSFFGASNNTNAIWMGTYNSLNSTGAFDFGTTRNAAHLAIGTRMRVELKEGKYTTSTGGAVSPNMGAFDVGLSAYLFSVNRQGSAFETAEARVYSAVMYDGKTVIRDFVPAIRIDDSVVGMYDTVSGEFFENKGTDDFRAGPEVKYVTPTTIEGVWSAKVNPDRILPAAYTQLSYIESTGTQYIDTGVSPTANTVWATDCQFVGDQNFGYDGAAMGSLGTVDGSGQRFHFIYMPNGGWQIGVGNAYKSVGNVDNNRHSFVLKGSGLVSIDSTEYSTGGTLSNSARIYLFNWYHTDASLTRPSAVRLYSSTITENGSVIRDFIPAKRNSDNVVGLYDLVNRVFYTKDGTGTFLAGEEIPPYIYGHLISKIKSLGVWTVSATNGEQTAEQDVLVDVITDYIIDMDFPVNYLMLYDFDDECEDVTNGWNVTTVTNSQISSKTATKNADHLYFSMVASGASAWPRVGFVTNNAMDLSAFSGVYFVGYGSLIDGIVTPQVSCHKIPPSDSAINHLLMTGGTSTTAPSVSTELAIKNVDDKNLYISVTATAQGNASCMGYVYSVFAVKPDDWATLCTTAGITTPSNLTTLIADTTSITTILNNEEAVKFMVSNCTGDFMVSFIQNADCIDAMQESSYVDLVFSNKHWKKFLDMVGVKPRLYLYNEGDKCVDVTGGWSTIKKGSGSASIGDTTFTGTTNQQTQSYGLCHANNKISLTGYSKLCIDADEIFGESAQLYLNTSSPTVLETQIDFKTTGKNSIDISNYQGSYYVCVGGEVGSTGKLRGGTFSRVWLE